MQQTSISKTTILIGILMAAAAIRVLLGLTGQTNYFFSLTPLGALFIFGSAYFKGWVKPFLYPLLALFISDVILCFTVYAPYWQGFLYSGWYWTYGAFFLMALMGKIVIREVSVKYIFLSVVAATLVHWLASNAGPCIAGNTQGDFFVEYGARLAHAISSETRLLIGTLIYAVLMFGGFTLLQVKYKGPILH